MALAPACDAGGPAGGPNVVLVSIDSLRADHLGCYGYERETSPAIDRLAAEGALFETAVSSTSWTLPAHASMFTGLPESVHGVDRTGRTLAPARRTLAESLKEAGYRTMGVWSGPYLHPHFGLDQGFERYESCASYFIDGAEQLVGKDREVFHESHDDVTSPRILEVVTPWLRERDGRPFFLFVHMWDVHYDYVPPAPYDTRFDPDYTGPVDGRGLSRPETFEGLAPRDLRHLIARYDGEIAWTDHHVGLLLDLLDELELAATTVVVVTSDHGEEFFEHGQFGHRKALFEESVRIPLVVRGPGIEPGRRIATLAGMVDLAPTILELAGAEPLANTLGRSLAPLLRGEASAHDAVVTSELYLRRVPLLAVRTGDWKVLVRTETDETVGVWNLAADPGERDNLIEGGGGVPEAARARLELMRAELARLAATHDRADGRGADMPDEVRTNLEELGYVE